MKTIKQASRNLSSCFVGLAIAALILSPTIGSAEEKGATKLIAHPHAARLLAEAQKKHVTAKSILDIPVSMAQPATASQWLSFQESTIMMKSFFITRATFLVATICRLAR